MSEAPPRRPRGLFRLVSDVPTLVAELVQREIALVKAELIGKLRSLGIGVGLIAAAVLVLLGTLGVLLTAAVLALSLVLPGWAAALIVAGVLLIVAMILGLIGYRRIVRTGPPLPTESIDSLQRDLRAIKGIGKRGSS